MMRMTSPMRTRRERAADDFARAARFCRDLLECIAAALTPISLAYYSTPRAAVTSRSSVISTSSTWDTFTEETQPNGLFDMWTRKFELWISVWSFR